MSSLSSLMRFHTSRVIRTFSARFHTKKVPTYRVDSSANNHILMSLSLCHIYVKNK